MATRLLRHGATLTHRRYLGQVSDRMAEHYTEVTVFEIDDILQHVWVAGPGAPTPGELLSKGDEPTRRRSAGSGPAPTADYFRHLSNLGFRASEFAAATTADTANTDLDSEQEKSA